MIYLIVSVLLVVTAFGLFIRGRLLNLPMTTSTYVILGVFALTGTAMTTAALQEIDEEQYTSVEKMVTTYPSLTPLVQKSGPVIYRYEYLDILQEYRQLAKQN